VILKLGVINCSWELAARFGTDQGYTVARFSLNGMFAPQMHLESGPDFPDMRKLWNVHLEVSDTGTSNVPLGRMTFAPKTDAKEPHNLFFFGRLRTFEFERLLSALVAGRAPSDVIIAIDKQHNSNGAPAFTIDNSFRTVWNNERCPEVPLTGIEFRFNVDRVAGGRSG
jgi:hypothetical protein